MTYRLVSLIKEHVILPLASANIAHLRSQFNHVFAVVSKALIFRKKGLKLSNFGKRKLQNIQALETPLPDPRIRFLQVYGNRHRWAQVR